MSRLAGAGELLQTRIQGLVEKSFRYGVRDVQPRVVLRETIQPDGDSIVIGNRRFAVKDCYIVGFGKAVTGMITPLLKVLRKVPDFRLKRGILSVPLGYAEKPTSDDGCDDSEREHIEICEGAKDNLPDEPAFVTAVKILNLAKDLSETDTLFVLVSGGGSALLPVPIAGLDLCEKVSITRQLSTAGATIQELNTVRKTLSAVKGGKFALCTKATVVSFIISDVIGDNLDVIASGPTVLNTDSQRDFIKILTKYNIVAHPTVMSLVDRAPSNAVTANADSFKHVNNFLIASNEIALKSVKYFMETRTQPTTTIMLSRELKGEASLVGGLIAILGLNILDYIESKRKAANTFPFNIADVCLDIGIANSKIKELFEILDYVQQRNQHSLCIIFGGETTVTITGEGKGGRNQELILAANLKLKEISETSQPSGMIFLLSGGTDGIDGPTEAAGAMTYYTKYLHSLVRLQCTEATDQSLDSAQFLANNNSYEYFRLLSNGKYHLKTGHTGTNVMDLVILYISFANVEPTI